MDVRCWVVITAFSLFAGLELILGYVYIVIPMLVVVLGATLNLTVILANGGRMPACTHTENEAKLVAELSVNYLPITGSTRFKFLADIIHITLPKSLKVTILIVSIGDLVIVGGMYSTIFAMIFQVIRQMYGIFFRL